MVLSPEQEAQLAELQAQANAPEPRTDTGVKGVLHTLIDVVSGVVPHLGEDAWKALHKQAEDGDQAAEPAEPAQDQAAEPAAAAEPSQPSVFGSESTPETAE
jgi:leucyl-tRNA synthetase